MGRLLTAVALCSLLYAQAHAWRASLNGTSPSQDFGGHIVSDGTGHAYVGGYLVDAGAGRDGFVVKLSGGAELWRRLVTGNVAGDDVIGPMVVAGNGDVIAGGEATNAGSGVDGTIVRLDAATGTELWRATIAGAPDEWESVRRLAVGPDGTLTAAVWVQHADFSADTIVSKRDAATGAELWSVTIDGAVPSALAIDAATGDAIVGGGDAGQQWFVKRLASATGAALWSGPGMALDGLPTAAVVEPMMGDVVLAGFGGIPNHLAVLRFDSTGTELWRSLTSGAAGYGDSASDVVVNAVGTAIATGILRDSTGEGQLAVVALAPADGDELWRTTIGSAAGAFGEGAAIATDAQGDFFVAGALTTASGGIDFAVAKLDPAGMLAWTYERDGTAHGLDAATGLALDAQGDPIAVGVVTHNATGADLTAVRLDGRTGVEISRFEASGDERGGDDGVNDLALDAAGNVVTAGWTRSQAGESFATATDFTVAKHAGCDGAQMWRYVVPSTDTVSGRAVAIAVHANGDVAAVGELRGSAGDADVAIVKLRADGTEAWRRLIDGSDPIEDVFRHDSARAVAFDADGAIIAAGALAQTPAFATGGLVVKLDADGNELWRSVAGSDVAQLLVLAGGDVLVVDGAGGARLLAGADGSTRSSVVASIPGSYPAVARDPLSGDVVIAGRTQSPVSDFALARIRQTPQGLEQTTASFDGEQDGPDDATAIAIDAAGNVYLAGVSFGAATANDFVVLSIAPDGARRWQRILDGERRYDEAWGIAVDASGGVVATGRLQRLSGESDFVVVRFDATTGVELWRRTFPGTGGLGNDRGVKIVSDAFGNVTAAGMIRNLGTGDDGLIVRLTADGADAACVPSAEGPAGSFACGDGVDDDCDGAVDLADPGCRECPASCDDDDTCTIDSCDESATCAHVDRTGAEAVTCAFERTLESGPCVGTTIRRSVHRRFEKARLLVDRALAAPPSRRRTLLRRAVRKLTSVRGVVTRLLRRGDLISDCADHLLSIFDDATGRIQGFGT